MMTVVASIKPVKWVGILTVIGFVLSGAGQSASSAGWTKSRINRVYGPAILRISKDCPIVEKAKISDAKISEKGHGTGFIVSRTGWVLTAAHVALPRKKLPFECTLPAQEFTCQQLDEEGKGTFKCRIPATKISCPPPKPQAPCKLEATIGSKGGQPYSLNLIKADRKLDIAILRIEDSESRPRWDFLPVDLYRPLSLNQTLFVAGFPGEQPLTIVSADVTALNADGFYQSAASVSFGNSGGPVISSRDGTVIGIVRSGLEGQPIKLFTPISFAAPILSIGGIGP
jgi:S1-C subfamily serine protease